MRILLLVVIKLYWFLIPESKRRQCLFKVSCSKYVFQITKSKGLLSGFRALILRINNCTPNYTIIELDGKQVLITRMNKVFDKNEINQSILK